MMLDRAAAARTLILGHRGASAEVPENTLRAFRRAAELGADGVEVDVQRSADGRLVLIHDEQVNRTTTGQGLVGDLPWSTLVTLDAGQGERIPTLDDLLTFAATQPGFFLNLELKMPGVGPDTLAALAQPQYQGPLALSSFDYPTLEEVRRRDRQVELWLLSSRWDDELIGKARAISAARIALVHHLIDASTAARAAEVGLGLVAWTADAPATLRRLLAVRPRLHAIISNRPDVALSERAAAETRGGGAT